MRLIAPILLVLLSFLAFSCTEYTPEKPEEDKCHAGEEWDGEKCVPRGCELDIHCDDALYCNGRETCGDDGVCQAGVTVDCSGAFACITGQCAEELDRCEFDYNHAMCPSGQVCDPDEGCVPGMQCTTADDCPERFCYIERDCTNGMCTWDAARDCSDAFECTEDKCNEAQGVCDHIPHDSECESTDRCLVGRCDPELGCVFDPAQGDPEVCDGIDNDCDGLVDEKEWNDAEGSICACLTPCESQADCRNQADGNSVCTSVAGRGSVCLSACDVNGACVGEKTCVSLELEETPSSICVCQADSCPQPCANNRECFVYGLSTCMGGRCTNPCLEDDQCPDPYFCDATIGYCSCPMDPGASCLACTLSIECDIRGMGNLCYDMNRGVPYRECKIHCSENNPCPYMTGDLLYCHHSTLCACRPPHGVCEDCALGENVCAPYRMECSLVGSAGTPPVHTCTAPCTDEYECPEGWLCQLVEGEGMRCLDPFCVDCIEISCDTQDTTSCDPFGYGLTCVDETGTNNGICTKSCVDSRDCPPGWTCLNEQCGCF